MSMEYDRCAQNLRDFDRERYFKRKDTMDNIRRTATRGLKRAQLRLDGEYVDLFQHILDEVDR